ncbi:inner nuclear membrane protein Man1 [Diretmus argenteus]
MAAAQLTDEELFSELKRFGFTPGPVTENTRPVYLKKLKKLREEQQQRGSRPGKTRSGGGINSTVGGGNTAGARPASHDVTHLSSSRRPGRKSSVLGFSSDESDAETPQRRRGLNHHSSRRDRGSGFQQQIRPAGTPGAARKTYGVSGSNVTANSNNSSGPDGQRSGSLGRVDRTKSSPGAEGRGYEEPGEEDGEGEADNDSPSLNGSRASYSNTSQLAGDYSDEDDEEEDGGPAFSDRQRDRLASRRSHPKTTSPPPHRGGRGSETGEAARAGDPSESLDMVVDKGEGAKDGRKRGESTLSGGLLNRSFPRRSIYVSLAGEHRAGPGHKNHVDGEDEACPSSSGTSRFSIGLRPRFSNYSSLYQTYRANHSNHTAPNHAYSQAALKQKLSVPEDELLQQFKREEVSSSGGFSAHYLSMFLLTAACLFFLLLGLMYLRMRGSGAAEVDVAIKSHPFGSLFDETYDKTEKDLILKLLLNLHDHLALIAGQHDCGDQQHLNRSLSMEETTAYLRGQSEDYDDFILSSLEWVIRTGEDVGIRLVGLNADDPLTDVSEILRLESTHPKMSFTCRFRRAVLTVISRVFLIAAVVGCVWGLVYYMKYRWRREEEETRQMYDMVERIIDVLRSHNEACQENQDLQPYLPIPHVRDSLVQPQDRKRMKKVWDRAVSFLSANESRIRTESQRIGGADFLVWRWIQPSLSCDKISLVPSKVWQGKAFPLDRRNSPPNSLTPCLKIRNMFDPVMEVGDNWDLAIHEAILEKCSDNDGIVHIAVDKNSREGCVYVKCLSAEHSGKAFKALHGSWFDGKLVTVKYLRLDRYHQRFPQAQGCSVPLKASSSHMNTVNTTNTTTTPRPQHSANSLGFS